MNRANQIKSKLYDGKPVFAPILSGNGYFDQWQTFRTSTVGMLHRTLIGSSWCRICKGLGIMRAGLATFSAPTVNR
jgi:hypothetical protein